jgi:hypothetical protein
MKKFQKLKRYPLGAIKVKGFLYDQMKRGKDGICGHLHELEPNMIADPFISKSFVPAWENGNQNGWVRRSQVITGQDIYSTPSPLTIPK